MELDTAEFFSSRLYQTMRSLVTAQPAPVYLVGGAVRDLLRGKPLHDLDFTLAGDVRPLARRTADTLGGAFYMLDDERNTARVIVNESGGRLVLDFAAQRGDSLEEDLRLRDFTINAIAMRLDETPQLVDPMGGANDLRHQTLRACSATSLVDDPLRVLRGIRLATTLHFRIIPETLQAMRAAVPGLERISAERVRDEVFRMLEGAQVSTSVRLLAQLGTLPYTLPELHMLKGVTQSAPHVLDVWEHTLAVTDELENLYRALAGEYQEEYGSNLWMGMTVLRLGRYREQFGALVGQELAPGRNIRSLLMLAALYHDTGKPERRSLEAGGRIRFLGHEEHGADLACKRAQALALSQAEITRLAVVIGGHMRIHLLTDERNLPSRRAIYRYFRATGEAGVDIILLSLADTLATYRTTLQAEHWQHVLDVCRVLLEAYWEHPQESVQPPRMIDGKDLMQVFDLRPGPQIGRLLAAVQEAQACGEVSTRDGALDLARRLLDETRNGLG